MTVHPDPELAKLLDGFVRVRIVQMGGVDLSLFQFDPFLSWSVFFMNADKTIYGRFGTAAPATKRSQVDSNPSHTTAGLRAALRRALEVHAGYTADPKSLQASLAGKTGAPLPWRTPEALPSSRKYRRGGRIAGADGKGCFHCHEVQRGLIDSYFMTGRELTDDMLWVHPSPAILGLTLSRDHCARVEAVAKGSRAAAAGVEAGDDILTLGGQPLLSVADVTWVLHRFPDAGGELSLEVRRGGETRKLQIELPKLWRRDGDFGWRYRVAGYAMWLWGGVSLVDHPKGIRVSDRSPNWFKKPNRDARQKLSPGDVIVEVDGAPGWTRSRYIAYLMREKKPGETVRLKVERDGATVEVRFAVPAERPEVLGH